MFQYNDYKIYLACGKTDMRKSINGLCDIVENHFQLDPREKIMFAFCNQRRNRIKLLVWEDNGFWVHFKRLEKGSIDWPEPSDDEAAMNSHWKTLQILFTPQAYARKSNAVRSGKINNSTGFIAQKMVKYTHILSDEGGF